MRYSLARGEKAAAAFRPSLRSLPSAPMVETRRSSPPTSAPSEPRRLPLYDLGAGHPMTPVRYRLAVELIAAYGLLDRDDVAVLDPRPATLEVIGRVHPEAYASAIRRFSDDPALSLAWDVQQQWGITPPGGDTPAVPGPTTAPPRCAASPWRRSWTSGG